MSLTEFQLRSESINDEMLDLEVVSCAWHKDHWCCLYLDDQGRMSYPCQNAPSLRASQRPVCAEREGRDSQPPKKKRRISLENLEDVVRDIVQTLSQASEASDEASEASDEASEASDEAREASDEAREVPNEPNEVGEEGREKAEEDVDGGQSENSTDDHKLPD